MLTHRNKKPYECKADGCGKSYCDARSLRRHTENHHTGNTASSTTSNRESSSPLASSCIQYAPPPVPSTTHSATTSCSSPTTTSSATSSSTATSKAPSQLQQLLASDATTSTTASTSSTKVGLGLLTGFSIGYITSRGLALLCRLRDKAWLRFKVSPLTASLFTSFDNKSRFEEFYKGHVWL